MQVVLVMFSPGGERRSFPVTREMTIIGRREDCDLRIPLGDVSRKHCRMIREADTLRIEDLGSSNGTYVNGQRIQEAILQPGDTVRVGPIAFVLQVDGLPADEDLHPSEGAPASSSEETGVRTARREPPPAEGEFDPMSALQDDDDANLDFDLDDDLNNSGSRINIKPSPHDEA